MNRLWPFRNLGLKFLSLGIGALLWISVSGEEVVERWDELLQIQSQMRGTGSKFRKMSW